MPKRSLENTGLLLILPKIRHPAEKDFIPLQRDVLCGNSVFKITDGDSYGLCQWFMERRGSVKIIAQIYLQPLL